MLALVGKLLPEIKYSMMVAKWSFSSFESCVNPADCQYVCNSSPGLATFFFFFFCRCSHKGTELLERNSNQTGFTVMLDYGGIRCEVAME